MFDVVFVEQIRDLSIMRFRKRNKEIVIAVLDNNIYQVLELRFPMKNLSLPVYNVFLQIKCNILGYTEVLHRIRHHNSEFIADPEEMINTGFACKNNSSKVENIDLLMSEIFCGNTLNLDERLKIYFEVVFFCQVEIWRFRI